MQGKRVDADSRSGAANNAGTINKALRNGLARVIFGTLQIEADLPSRQNAIAEAHTAVKEQM
jgi:hypothetical protein